MSTAIGEVNDDNFEREVLQSEEPVLVDFWAEWCAPCRALAPTVEALAMDWAERGRVVKLNVDDSPRTTARYDVRGIPTLILFKDGAEIERLLGAASKTEIVRKIDPYMGRSVN
jgi:thioredoxin 1